MSDQRKSPKRMCDTAVRAVRTFVLHTVQAVTNCGQQVGTHSGVTDVHKRRQMMGQMMGNDVIWAKLQA